MTTQQDKSTRFVPVTKWPDLHPWPNIGGLRHLIFNAQKNGFNKVIVRAGRRVLLDERAFFEWLDEKRDGGAK
jgi:hypothetical protein